MSSQQARIHFAGDKTVVVRGGVQDVVNQLGANAAPGFRAVSRGDDDDILYVNASRVLYVEDATPDTS